MLRCFSQSYQSQAKRLYNATYRYISQQAAVQRQKVNVISQQAVQSVSHINNGEYLAVKWHDGTEDKFPHLYLRENCRCDQCFRSTQKIRLVNVPKFIDLNVTAETVDVKNDGDQLNVTWKDGHSSVYSSEFLRNLRYKKPGEGQPAGVLRKGTKLWGSEFSEDEKLPSFDFEKLIENDQKLYDWLVTLATGTGIAKLTNVLTERNQLQLLGDKVGYLVETVYGTQYDIRAFSENKATTTGYTSRELPMHADYTFCHTSPAIVMLHCIEQTETEGGLSQWVDAFHAAHLLYQENPKGFNVLVKTPISFYNECATDYGEFNTACRRNLISLDPDRKLSAVCYSDEFRDAHMPLPPDEMKSFYKAYFRLFELMNDARCSFWIKMKPGEIFTANNHRVLHGRSAYVDSDKNIRLLQLGYLDWDCVHTKIRIHAKKQGIESPID